MKFTYSSGQRVLDGYTLKRGIGRGGFGEVYYAVSDGGKEVALKLVRGGNMDVEVRGMAQCLNLKHPNLLTLYDLRTDDEGGHWVVMEYIAGEALNTVLARHPKGLPPELARQWFLSLAKAVNCLHEQGIVHRDLKPANIFLENGVLKVGDYGLSKCISASHHTAQTQSIGTVHYMAPEISTGNYNRQIDVYAAGIVFYEMLTGRVPFDGESAGEILMKHLTSPPDLNRLPVEWMTTVGKALAKNPTHRYATMAEFARAVESVGQPEAPKRKPIEIPRPIQAPTPPPVMDVIPVPPPSVGARVVELCRSLAVASVVSGVGALLWTQITAASGTKLTQILVGFYLTVASCWAILIPAKVWEGKRGDSGMRRIWMLGFGLAIGLGALWLQGWSPRPDFDDPAGEAAANLPFVGPIAQPLTLLGYLCYFGALFFSVRWWTLVERSRPRMFSATGVLLTGFWAAVLLVVWPWSSGHAPLEAVSLVLASSVVQFVSPWDPPRPAATRRMRLRYS